MKKLAYILPLVLLLTACSKDNSIDLVSREDGSGTRTAFTEITEVKKDGIDKTFEEAVIQNSTDAVMTIIEKDLNAIGYISLGSLNNTVKPVKIENVEPTVKNIENGRYKLTRNFILLYNSNLSEKEKDFLKFINSKQGQAIVKEEGYVPVKSNYNYKGINNRDNITIAGSTSVTPLMEKLVEGYKRFNPGFNADIQSTGSSAGIKAVMDKSVEFGMSSRELKDDELKLNNQIIARDGIIVIVNNKSKINDLSVDEVKKIFTGDIKSWDADEK